MNNGLCIFGEVLFDHFPDGKRVLGGAPFNVAWHLQAFGQAPHFISRVGDDAEGETIRAAMQQWGMDTSGLQTDPELPTGRVDVSFDDGEPSYEIVRPCAYDAIAAPPAGACRLLYHGSLALREDASRQALEALRTSAPGTVFVDVNLRPPWWGREQMAGLLRGADWVKLNADELAQLHPLQAPGDTPNAQSFLAAYQLEGLVVTHGALGAELLTAAGERFHASPLAGIRVVDTVGAGDAFASVMILGLANDWPLQLTLERAQAFAARVVGNRGATVSDPAFYQSLVDEWTLAH